MKNPKTLTHSPTCVASNKSKSSTTATALNPCKLRVHLPMTLRFQFLEPSTTLRPSAHAHPPDSSQPEWPSCAITRTSSHPEPSHSPRITARLCSYPERLKSLVAQHELRNPRYHVVVVRLELSSVLRFSSYSRCHTTVSHVIS